MANLHLVTGYAGTEHVTAADQGAFHALTMGNRQCVIKTGNQFAASVVTNNKVKVLDGEIYMHGRYIRLDPNTYTELAIESGEQGKKRHDLIVARYIKGLATGVEEANLVVIKGTATESTPSDPAYTTGNILNGDAQNDLPLFRVVIEGLTLTNIEKLFTAESFGLDNKQNCTDLLAEENAIADADHIPFYDASVKGHRKILWSKVKEFFAKAKHRHDITDIDNVTNVAPYMYAIGDTLTTLRTNLNNKWALCNGGIVYRDNGNTELELYDMLDPGLADRTAAIPGVNVSSDIYQMKNGAWSINYYEASSQKAAVFNPLTGLLKVVSKTGNGLTADSIIGITWNGSKYVCCTIHGSYLIFYTSSDLETWTEAARHAPEKSPTWGSSYGDMGFVWDGAAYRVACQWSGYQANYMHTYDANFAYLNAVDATDCGIYAADGLFCLGGESNSKLYEPGTTTVLYSASTAVASGYGVFEKYGENKYVLVPIAGYSPYLRFYDKSTNTLKALDIQTAFRYPYYFDCVNYDPNTRELVFRLFTSDSSDWYDARISVDADMTNADNYTLRKIDASVNGKYTHLLVHDDMWTNIRGSDIRGLHPRTLPIISHDKAYTYIKVKEGA